MNQSIRQEENKGQTSQLGSPRNVLKNIDDLETFDREIPYSFLRKKAEKLATATYLVTGFLSDSEPIKWQIRECGLSILSDVISVANPPMSEMAHRVKSIASGIGKITSLFEIAAAAGFVSGMNLAILKEEYLSIAQTVENRKIGRPEGGYVFSKDFFQSREPAPEPVSPSVSETETFTGDDSYKRHFKKDVENVQYKTKEDREIIADEPPPRSNIPDTVSVHILPKRGEKNSRRETVLSIIKDKGEHAEVSIKDVVGHFSDCGEKTIQRELTALVDEGVLKKTGERRWSRYSFS